MSNLYGDVERTIVEGNIAFDNPEKNENDWVCEDCGCDRVQERAWVNLNTREDQGSCDDDETYCPDCQEYTCIISRKEYLEANQEDEDEGV